MRRVALALVLVAACKSSSAAAPGAPVEPTALGYAVLASSGSGRAIFATKPAADAKTALAAAAADLAKIFGEKPAITGAFTDRQGRGGGATFTGALGGRSVRGTIMCGVGAKGAAVTILYDDAGAPAAEWNALTAALPAADAALRARSIGQGVGTIGVPDGWTVTSANNVGTVDVRGPAMQDVDLGVGLEILGPGSMGANTQEQLAAAGQLPPGARMLVAPFTGPEDALPNLMPQLSAMSQAAGGPGFTLDKILETDPVPAQLPGGRAARVYYAATETDAGRATRTRTWAQLETYPIGGGAWGLFFSLVSGPDATFDRDLPTMLAIAKSWKLDDAVVAQHTQANVAAQNQRFAAFEHSMQDRQDAFDAYLADQQQNQTIRDRSNADFDEVIRGYRTVEDTATGERGSAELGDVDRIVDKLNEADPGRYIQIPLRDEELP